MKTIIKKISVVCVAVIAVMLTPILLKGCSNSNEYDFTVGILSGAQIPAFAEGNPGFQNRLRELMAEQDKTVRFIYQNANNSGSTATTIANSFAIQRVDLIFSMGTGATQNALPVAIANEIPLVYGIITDPVGNNFNTDWSTGSSSALPFRTQIDLLEELTGAPLGPTNRVAYIYTTTEANSVATGNRLVRYAPGVGTAMAAAENEVANDGYSVRTFGIQTMFQLQQQFNLIANDPTISIIYIGQDNQITGNMPNVADLNRTFTSLPIVVADLPIVEGGAIASLSVCFEQNGARAAELAFEILFNEKSPADLEFYAPSADTLSLYVNIGEARVIDFTIPQAMVERADLVIDGSPGTGNNFPWVWVGVGVGTAIVIGAGVWAVMFFVKRKSEKEVI